MPTNKKHHYVPAFYLRRFSKNGKSINLYHIASRRKVSGANLRNQCYRDYLYGKELTIEHSLSVAEGIAAEVFRRIDSHERLPRPGIQDHLTLILYLLMQHGRTVHTVEALDEMTNSFMQHLMAEEAKRDGIDISGVRISLKESSKLALATIVRAYPLLFDLHYKLLLNETNVEFVTSDNPVVLYNQLCSFRAFVSNCGLSNKGLQIFFPIDPKKQIVLFDSEVYRVGPDSAGIVRVTNPQDIYELNALQMCSANDTIYFKSAELDVASLHKKTEPFLQKIKSRFRVFPKESVGARRSELLMSSRNDVRTDLTLSFLTLRGSARRWREGVRRQGRQPAVFIRSSALLKEFEIFEKLVESGDYSTAEFFKFMEERRRR